MEIIDLIDKSLALGVALLALAQMARAMNEQRLHNQKTQDRLLDMIKSLCNSRCAEQED